MAETLRLIYHTAKVRLGFLIMACTLTGVAVIPDHALAAWQIFVLGLATLIASSAAGAFNQFYERDVDARMQRTSARPERADRGRARAFAPGAPSLSDVKLETTLFFAPPAADAR